MSALDDYRRWTYSVAHGLIRTAPESCRLDVDDVAQEGLLALWQAEAAYSPERGSLPAYLTLCARRRMRAVVLRGRPVTGEEGVRGKVTDRRAPAPSSLEALAEGEDDLPTALVSPSGEDALLDRIAVRAAVATLPERDREALFRRFWLGESPTHADRHRFTSTLRPQLAETLTDVA